MRDRFDRRKLAFWLFFSVLAALTLVPSAVMLRALRSYYAFLTGAAPSTIRPIQVRFLDHSGDSRSPDRDIQFLELRLRAPKAKAVELIGDFNGWRPGTLPLSRGKAGAWELMLPLPPGTYRYLFLVDGQPQPDPAAPPSVTPDGKPASTRTLK